MQHLGLPAENRIMFFEKAILPSQKENHFYISANGHEFCRRPRRSPGNIGLPRKRRIAPFGGFNGWIGRRP